LGNLKQGFGLPLHHKRTKAPAPLSPFVFSAEFGKEKSVPLNNLTVDEVAKALENIVKSTV